VAKLPRSTQEYEAFLKTLYMRTKRDVEEIEVPPAQIVSVTGSGSPKEGKFQEAIPVLYGVAYTLKMGLKFGKLAKPAGYFDYKVGALEALWWTDRGEFDIKKPKTWRWQVFLMVPAFVPRKLFEEARDQAQQKHPEQRYEVAELTRIDEGHAIQVLHIGPYDQEQPTIEKLHEYANAKGLRISGKHHEIYLSDPRRTQPEKLKTVLRLPVKKA
jgi:hypothetical protein